MPTFQVQTLKFSPVATAKTVSSSLGVGARTERGGRARDDDEARLPAILFAASRAASSIASRLRIAGRRPGARAQDRSARQQLAPPRPPLLSEDSAAHVYIYIYRYIYIYIHIPPYIQIAVIRCFVRFGFWGFWFIGFEVSRKSPLREISATGNPRYGKSPLREISATGNLRYGKSPCRV